MDSDRIASIRTEMNKKANDFFAFDENNNPTRKYLAKEDREWVQHQTNLLSESKAYETKKQSIAIIVRIHAGGNYGGRIRD